MLKKQWNQSFGICYLLFFQTLFLIDLILPFHMTCCRENKKKQLITTNFWLTKCCSEFHGKDGPLRIERPSPSPLADKLVEAGWSLGYPPSNDYNTGSTQGKLFNNLLNFSEACYFSWKNDRIITFQM